MNKSESVQILNLSLEAKVAIKPYMKKRLPLPDIQSRPAIAEVF